MSVGKLTNEQIEQLSVDWRAGILIREMETKLGCSKGIIMGHVHRNNLERPDGFQAVKISRKWPTGVKIVTGPDDPENIPRHKVAFDPIPSPHEQITATHDRNIATPVITARPRKISPFDNLAPRPMPSEIPTPKYGRVIECTWIIGEPKIIGTTFCDVPSTPGKPFCSEHCKAAYIPTSKLNTSGISR